MVSEPDPIDAMDDSYTATAEEGVNGITLGDVLSNDVINGVPETLQMLQSLQIQKVHLR